MTTLASWKDFDGMDLHDRSDMECKGCTAWDFPKIHDGCGGLIHQVVSFSGDIGEQTNYDYACDECLTYWDEFEWWKLTGA